MGKGGAESMASLASLATVATVIELEKFEQKFRLSQDVCLGRVYAYVVLLLSYFVVLLYSLPFTTIYGE